jgi:hypothetical protein
MKPLMKFTALKTRKAEKLIDELDKIQRRITERAYEIFRNRGAALGAALDDWLTAGRPLAGAVRARCLRLAPRRSLVPRLRDGIQFGTVCQNGG